MKLNAVVPVSPSLTDTLLMETTGAASSFVIVVVALAVPTVRFVGLLNVSTMVSSVSNTVSPVMVTTTVFVVSPAAKLSVPVAAPV